MRVEYFCTSTTAESKAKNLCEPLVAWAAVRSKAVALLSLICC